MSVAYAGSTSVEGAFAFQGGKAITDGHMRYAQIGSDPLYQHISIWMSPPGSAQPITNYAIEMTKALHVIVVDTTLSTFLHIHPQLGADGIFTIDQRVPAPGTYYVFADGVPNGGDHQVFRFVMRVGKGGTPRRPALEPTGRELTVGPYTVDLSKARLTAGSMDQLRVEVSKDDAPAKDLHPYLGAPAHAVFLNTADLTYLHVHPMLDDKPGSGTGKPAMNMKGMDMSAMNMSAMNMDLPDAAPLPAAMVLNVSVREQGLYKMWLQFRGGDQLYVAPFVLRAE